MIIEKICVSPEFIVTWQWKCMRCGSCFQPLPPVDVNILPCLYRPAMNQLAENSMPTFWAAAMDLGMKWLRPLSRYPGNGWCKIYWAKKGLCEKALFSFCTIIFHGTSCHGNTFCNTGPLWGKFTGHGWIPFTRASNAELWCSFVVSLNKLLNKQLR